MTTAGKKNFVIQSEIKAGDFVRRRKIEKHIANVATTFNESVKSIHQLEQAKKLAKNIRWHAIENIDTLLLTFEENFTAQGGKVIWANTVAEAQKAILDIINQQPNKPVLKSGHGILNEINLNAFLSRSGIQFIESSTDNFIQQLDTEPPIHPVNAALDKSAGDIARLFHKHLDAEANLHPHELLELARNYIRNSALQASISITGADFLLADSGAVSIMDNEGNGRLCAALPKIHIVVSGIDKVLEHIDDLSLFHRLYATHSVGQPSMMHNTILSGPKSSNEKDGPEDMYVILMDNGRSNMLADTTLRESLYCISCGACHNVCPVFKAIGGDTYQSAYSGPIGEIQAPHLHDFEGYQHLSYASTLCGQCTLACPVNIALDKLLHTNRKLSHVFETTETTENNRWNEWKRHFTKSALFPGSDKKLKKFLIENFFSKELITSEENVLSTDSFSRLYKKQSN